MPASRVQGHLDLPTIGTTARWVDWDVTPLRDGQAVTGWLVVADDRTDYQRWQRVARQAERLGTTAALVGSLAHELRNPLASARGLLQLMSRRHGSGQVAGYVDLAVRELDRVTWPVGGFGRHRGRRPVPGPVPSGGVGGGCSRTGVPRVGRTARHAGREPPRHRRRPGGKAAGVV